MSITSPRLWPNSVIVFSFATLLSLTTSAQSQTVLLSDNFSGPGIDPNKWSKGTNSGNQAAIENGALTLRSTSNHSGWIVTKTSYAGANKIAKLKIVQPNDDGDLGMSPTVNLASTNAFYSQNNWYRLYVYREGHTGSYRLYVQWKRNGSEGGLEVTNGLALPGSFYLRLRTDATTIFFEYSPDDQSWTTVYQEPFSLPGYALSNNYYFELSASNTSFNGDLKVDDFVLQESNAIPDTQAPIISNVQTSNLSATAATITWTTNEASDSQVEYGLTTGYGNMTPLETMLLTNHAVALNGLTKNSTYHFRVKSKDAAGNPGLSGDFSFTTPNASPLSFTDITLAAGTGGPTGPNQVGGHAAIFADVDGDGRPDLYHTMLGVFADPMPDLFFHNTGNNIFVEEGALRGLADFDGGSHGAVFGDLDNDGDFDLYNGTTDGTTNIPGINNIYRNNGNGTFTEVTASSGMPVREWQTRATVAFDLDNDGDLDLFAVTDYLGTDDPSSDRNEVYRNDGAMQFTAINSGALFEARAGQGATDTDFDNDGDVDIFTANRTGDMNILRNDGGGVFTQISPASIGITHRADDGITSADVDNDGDLDLLLARDDSGTLYRNSGGGTFAFTQNFTATDGYMGSFADLDNDGDLDLVFAGDDVSYLNNGAGIFAPGPAIPVTGIDDPRAIGFADIDHDGDMDFAFGCKRSRNWLVRNNNAEGNWLKIKLISPQGQAGAFGAKTKFYPAGQAGAALLGMRESHSNNGYLGQDDQTVHFGLGVRTAVDVVVSFPDGTVVTRTNVAANQTLLVNGVTADARTPSLSNPTATNLTSTSATIVWQTDEIATSQVEYGTTSALGSATDIENILRTHHSAGLANLTAQTTYFYRVVSVDLAGNRAQSEILSFTTTAATGPILADDFPGNALDTNKWRSGANSGNLSRVAGNVLELRSQFAQTGWVITRDAFAARQTAVSVKVVQPSNDGNLGMSPTYTLSSSNGIYNEGTWYRFYVYRDATSGPYRLFVQWKKSGVVNGMDVTGSAVLNGVFYMRLRFDEARIYFEFSLDGNAWAVAYSEPFGLTGYSLDSPFYYELAAYRTDVKGILQVDDFSIDPSAPGSDTQAPVIAQVGEGNITATAATVTWNTNEASDSQVEYGPTASYGFFSPLDAALVTAHSVALANLNPSTLYHYRVRSRDAAGNLALSEDFTFQTGVLDTEAPLISNIVAQNITATGAQVTFTTNESAYGSVEFDARPHGVIPLMPLGDSITEGTGSSDDTGYRAPLYLALTDFGSRFDFVGSLQYGAGIPDLDHEGHAGWLANEIFAELGSFLNQSQPQAVLLHLGTNDVSVGDDAGTVVSEISAVVDAILQFDPATKVYLSTLIPRRDGKQNVNAAVNAQLPGVVSTRRNAGYDVFLVDNSAAFLANPNWANEWFVDHVHPNDAGYAVMAAAWREAYVNTEYDFRASNATLAVSHALTLTGLAPSTTYHYRARAKDAANLESASADLSFTTTASSAITLFADNFNASTLDLNKWTRGSNNGNQTAVTNGALQLRSNNTQSGWVITRQNYPARNTTVTVRVTQPNNDGNLGMSPTYQASSTAGIYGQQNWYRFYVYREQPGNYRLYVQWKKNGVVGGLDATGALAIPGAVYLRLRLDDTQIHFEASLNGATWIDTYRENFGLPGYTLNSNFHYELSAYRTNANGVLVADDFAIVSEKSQEKSSEASPDGVHQVATLPAAFGLHNYPNPFNIATRIRFDLPAAAQVEVAVFDAMGRQVRMLAEGWRPAGSHEMIWEGKNEAGAALSTGTYFLRMHYRPEGGQNFTQMVRRIMLLK